MTRPAAVPRGHHESARRSSHGGDRHRTGIAGARLRPDIRPRAGHERAQRLYERRRRTRAAGGNRRTRQTPSARYAGVDDLRIGIAARPGGASVTSATRGAKGAATIAGFALTAATDRCRACQWRHGACRRDRRFAQRIALASGLRGGARGARGRRGIRHRRRALPARRDARLRHRHARRHGHGRRRVQLREQSRHAQHCRNVRRRGRRGAAPPASMRARCAGRSTIPRSNPRGSSPGGATPITSRRRSCSRGMPARNGVTSALLVQIGLERRRRHLLRRRQFLRSPMRRRRNPSG